jgi:O-antigen/teichoic acid export membrane protein
MSQPESGSLLIKNSVLTLVNYLLSFSTSWIISIWVARQLGPANYGVFSLVLWLMGTISWALGLGFIHAVTKFTAEFKGKADHETVVAIVRFVFGIELVITVLSTVVLIFFELPIADYFFTPRETFYFFLAFLGLAPGMATAVFSATIEGLQKFEYFLYSSLIITPLSFAAKIFVLVNGQGINGLLIVMLIFSFVNALFYAYVLRR